MTIVPLGPILGAAAGALAARAADSIAERLSFAQMFAGLSEPTSVPAIQDDDLATTGTQELAGGENALSSVLDKLHARITQFLKSAGIDTSTPWRLHAQTDGTLHAADHPQAGAINHVLANNENARAAVQQAVSLLRETSQQNSQREWEKLHALDPVAASRVWHQRESNSDRATAQVLVSPAGFQTQF